MSRLIIGTLVAAVILFIWQFLSWALLNVHGQEMQSTPKQDTILAVLSQHLEEGDYFLPQPAKGASQEEYQQFMEQQEGKPWAKVSYRKSFTTNMGMNMVRGFAVDLLSAFFLVWILLKIDNLTFSTAFIASLGIGFIGYFTISYLNSVWFEGSTLGYLVDTVAQWGIVGLWLGFWLTRK